MTARIRVVLRKHIKMKMRRLNAIDLQFEDGLRAVIHTIDECSCLGESASPAGDGAIAAYLQLYFRKIRLGE